MFLKQYELLAFKLSYVSMTIFGRLLAFSTSVQAQTFDRCVPFF